MNTAPQKQSSTGNDEKISPWNKFIDGESLNDAITLLASGLKPFAYIGSDISFPTDPEVIIADITKKLEESLEKSYDSDDDEKEIISKYDTPDGLLFETYLLVEQDLTSYQVDSAKKGYESATLSFALALQPGGLALILEGAFNTQIWKDTYKNATAEDIVKAKQEFIEKLSEKIGRDKQKKGGFFENNSVLINKTIDCCQQALTDASKNLLEGAKQLKM